MSVSTALDEIAAALSSLAAAHEGLRDYARLDLLPDATQSVTEALARFDRRARALMNATLALEALLADGYPELESISVTPVVLSDLRTNADTIAAALRLFVVDEAVTLNIVEGEKEEQ